MEKTLAEHPSGLPPLKQNKKRTDFTTTASSAKSLSKPPGSHSRRSDESGRPKRHSRRESSKHPSSNFGKYSQSPSSVDKSTVNAIRKSSEFSVDSFLMDVPDEDVDPTQDIDDDMQFFELDKDGYPVLKQHVASALPSDL